MYFTASDGYQTFLVFSPTLHKNNKKGTTWISIGMLLYSNFILNLHIVYELNDWIRNPSNKFILKTYLFVTVKLTRSTIKSKNIYSG